MSSMQSSSSESDTESMEHRKRRMFRPHLEPMNCPGVPFLRLLSWRESGSLSCSRSQLDHHLLRRLWISKDTRTLAHVGAPEELENHTHHTTQTLHSVGAAYPFQDKVLIRAPPNYDCYRFDGTAVYKIYSLPVQPKLKSVVIWMGPGCPSKPGKLANDSHKTTIIVLREDNCIYFYDAENGALKETVYLGMRNTFKELILDDTHGFLYVQSIIQRDRVRPTQHPRVHIIEDGFVFVSIIVLSYPPLKFISHLEVRNSAFDLRNRPQNAEVYIGTLLFKFPNEVIAAYSLETILKKHNTPIYELDQLTDEHDPSSAIGRRPMGLPVTASLNSLKDMAQLMRVTAYQHHLEVGAYPYRYAVANDENSISIKNIANNIVLKDGDFELDVNSHWCLLNFHEDESSRIIYINYQDLSFYDVYPDCPVKHPNGCVKLACAFTCDQNGLVRKPRTENQNQNENNPITHTVSSRGRLIKFITPPPPPKNEESRLVYFFEDELDLLFIVNLRESKIERSASDGEDEELARCCTAAKIKKVVVIDNQRYEVLREFNLDRVIAIGVNIIDELQLSVHVDREYLCINSRVMGQYASLFMFSLAGEG